MSPTPRTGPGRSAGGRPAGRALAGAGLALAGSATELALLAALVAGDPAPAPWLAGHALGAAVAGTGVALFAAARTRTALARWLVPCLALAAAMPFVGAFGLGLALLRATSGAGTDRGEASWWRTIEPVALPFTAPAHRPVPRHDRRGLGEQLRHSDDLDTLYRRVLAAASMRDALSIGALKTAVAHPDDRIRLSAYQTVDTKVTALNVEIQRLEAAIDRLDETAAARERSNAWLQVATNYRELLTLEEGEPVARRQLLSRARAAAGRAVAALPTNRNAHYTLGRLALLEGDLACADAALGRAIELGMSPDTVAPRLAESAFAARDFARVAALLEAVSPAHRAHPPLRQVAEYWR